METVTYPNPTILVANPCFSALPSSTTPPTPILPIIDLCDLKICCILPPQLHPQALLAATFHSTLQKYYKPIHTFTLPLDPSSHTFSDEQTDTIVQVLCQFEYLLLLGSPAYLESVQTHPIFTSLLNNDVPMTRHHKLQGVHSKPSKIVLVGINTDLDGLVNIPAQLPALPLNHERVAYIYHPVPIPTLAQDNATTAISPSHLVSSPPLIDLSNPTPHQTTIATVAMEAAQSIFGGLPITNLHPPSSQLLPTPHIRLSYLPPLPSSSQALTTTSSPPHPLHKYDLTALHKTISDLVAEAYLNRASPSGVIVVQKDNCVIYSQAFGSHTYPDTTPQPQTTTETTSATQTPTTPATPLPTLLDSVYDVASLTKIVATTPSIMNLVQTGKIDLDAPLGRFPLPLSRLDADTDFTVIRQDTTHNVVRVNNQRLNECLALREQVEQQQCERLTQLNGPSKIAPNTPTTPFPDQIPSSSTNLTPSTPDQPTSTSTSPLEPTHNKAHIPLRSILLHEAGLIPYIKFYESCPWAASAPASPQHTLPDPITHNIDPTDPHNHLHSTPTPTHSVEVAPHCYIRNHYYYSTMWPTMLYSPLQVPGRYVYSDLSMYIMKELVEVLEKRGLQHYVHQLLYKPLGMASTTFQPLTSGTIRWTSVRYADFSNPEDPIWSEAGACKSADNGTSDHARIGAGADSQGSPAIEIYNDAYFNALDTQLDQTTLSSNGSGRTLTTSAKAPSTGHPAHHIVPTEQGDFRRALLQGHVHDEGCSMVGGVAGHAGLFSSAPDLAKYAQLLLNRGTYGGREYFSPSTVDQFTTCANPARSRRGLGFDRWDPDRTTQYPSALANSTVFGHTGFTGTCLWIDPHHRLAFTYLANRVHPNRGDVFLTKLYRQRILDAIYRTIGVTVEPVLAQGVQ